MTSRSIFSQRGSWKRTSSGRQLDLGEHETRELAREDVDLAHEPGGQRHGVAPLADRRPRRVAVTHEPRVLAGIDDPLDLLARPRREPPLGRVRVLDPAAGPGRAADARAALIG